ncbi:MAG: sugar ABC transporter permease, partial [Ensifer adhaerens]
MRRFGKRLSLLATCALLQLGSAAAEDASTKIVDDPLELTIHFHFRDKYVYTENWPVEKKAAEWTGIHVKNVASLATSNSRDAFNLLMASGDLPDIV